METAQKKAVVLLSGGLDSTTVLALALRQGFDVYALSFRYGQRHQIELERATAIANSFGVSHHIVVEIDLAQFGGSALTTSSAVPKHQSVEEIGNQIPITYVPARNTVFLALALAYAESLDCFDIFIGVNALDYSGYPDCRPEFIQSFQALANLATKATVSGIRRLQIHAPLIHLTKSQIISQGIELGVDYSMTTSCYDPDAIGRACGHCDACLLRLRGFAETSITDPADYQE